MSETIEVVIKSEEDAWLWLELAKNGDIDDTDFYSLKFDGWPSFQMRYTGNDFSQSVPTRIMPSLLTAQNEINKAYALVKYGSANPKKLNKKDRDEIELNVTVKNGSSSYDINLQEVLNEFVKTATANMTPTNAIIIAIVLGIAWAAPAAWKHWLEHKSKEKESNDRVKLSEIESAKSVKLSEIEKQKMQLIADVKVSMPQVQLIQDGADHYKNESLRKLKPDDNFNLPNADFSIAGHTANRITTTPREESTEIRIDGEFSIVGVDSGEVNGFKLHVKRILDGKNIRVLADDEVITKEVRATLQRSEWHKSKVILEINARMLRGEITAAHLISARLPAEE